MSKDRICLITNDVETTSILNHKLRDKTGEYVLSQGMPRLLDLYDQYGVKATFTTVDKLVLLPENAAVPTESHFTFKYGVMGFAIGVLFGSLVLAIIALRGRKDD